jgi:hypothetical protein
MLLKATMVGVVNVTITLSGSNQTEVKQMSDNSIYLHYYAVSTGRRRDCTKHYSLDRTVRDVLVTLESQDLYSWRWPLYNRLHAMNFGDLMSPYPYNAWAGQSSCAFDCRTVLPGQLYPVLALQTQLRRVSPEWKTCYLDPRGKCRAKSTGLSI